MTDTPYPPARAAAPARVISALAVAALMLSLAPFVMTYGHSLVQQDIPAVNHLFATLAVVLSVVFGISALHRIKKRGQYGQVPAIVGLVISGAVIAYSTTWVAVYEWTLGVWVW